MENPRKNWRKASYSTGTGGNCVEVAGFSATVGLRDSKDPGSGHIALDPAAFKGLLAQVKQLDV